MLGGMKKLISERPWIPCQLGKFISRIPYPNCLKIAMWERLHKKKALCFAKRTYLPNSLIASPKKWQETAPNTFRETPDSFRENALNSMSVSIILCRKTRYNSIEDADSNNYPYLAYPVWKAFFVRSRFIPWSKAGNKFRYISCRYRIPRMFTFIRFPKPKTRKSISDHESIFAVWQRKSTGIIGKVHN